LFHGAKFLNRPGVGFDKIGHRRLVLIAKLFIKMFWTKRLNEIVWGGVSLDSGYGAGDPHHPGEQVLDRGIGVGTARAAATVAASSRHVPAMAVREAASADRCLAAVGRARAPCRFAIKLPLRFAHGGKGNVDQ